MICYLKDLLVCGSQSKHQQMWVVLKRQTKVPTMRLMYWKEQLQSCLYSTKSSSWQRIIRKQHYGTDISIECYHIACQLLYFNDRFLTLDTPWMLAKHYFSIWCHRSSCKFLPKYIQPVFRAKRIKPSNMSSKHLDLLATRNQDRQKPMSLEPYRKLVRPTRETRIITFPFLEVGRRHLQNSLYIIAKLSTTISSIQWTNRVQVSIRTLPVHLKL